MAESNGDIPLIPDSLLRHPEPASGGPITKPLENAGHNLKEAGAGIFGTVERWSKSAWEGIKHAWNISKEHLAKWFPINHFHWTGEWMAAAGGAGTLGLLAAVNIFNGWRRKKRQETQEQTAH